jgi:lipopolysaccharide transport protein LptA
VNRSFAVFCILFFAWIAQGTTQPVASPSPVQKKKQEKKEKPAFDNSNPLLSGIKGAPTNGPITTEIYADDAFFDSNKSMGTFSGHVKIADPRFTLQAEKLTVYITKGENQGLEKAIADGNVAVVRDRPDPNGGPPTRAVGRSDQATYIATTGNVELRGSPRVQEGVNTHIGTSPDTVMIVNQNGQLTTRGPSRTEIRQEPKNDDGKKEDDGRKKKDEKSSAPPKPSASP